MNKMQTETQIPNKPAVHHRAEAIERLYTRFPCISVLLPAVLLQLYCAENLAK